MTWLDYRRAFSEAVARHYLVVAGGSPSRAARLLGVKRDHFYKLGVVGKVPPPWLKRVTP